MKISDILNIPLGWLLKICYTIVPNYLIALMLVAFVIKVILFPLGIKQQKNMVKQASLRPKEMAIRKRYAGRTDKATQQKLNEEIMNLYQKENFNPMGGCLPMLIQLPIIYSLYMVVTNPLKYICGLGSSTLSAIAEKISGLYADGALSGLSDTIMNKLSKGASLTGMETIGIMRSVGYDSFAEQLGGFDPAKIPSFTAFGGKIDLLTHPSFTSVLILVPILTFVVMFFSMRLTRKMTYQPDVGGDAAKSMKIMDFTMPLISTWITFTVPAILGIYWIYQNIFSTLQQFVLKKMFPIPQFTEEDYKRAEKEMNGKIKKKSTTKQKVRSLHRIEEMDDETDEGDSDDAPRELTDAESKIAPAPLKEDARDKSQKKSGKKSKGEASDGSDDNADDTVGEKSDEKTDE